MRCPDCGEFLEPNDMPGPLCRWCEEQRDKEDEEKEADKEREKPPQE